ncbi:16S rRNA (adenine(1518)-N(6)/adenine(1519)-N(6))-dimethyltransferase RsmA [Geothermobacter hydrogeniphilus]|uniref:Ribosomal RNA small subunit methyltransferase A n=1 Tax=Geothermobacter hydrogeniphilus TaxID=1969733 RepID=A0A1X0Y8Z1_9BACT|nr:16S rRNA (adenine(1518)-N(6)/adenine(1519)-N(6))-dimethyltransferase RsmA [Geothermobacter hydrogeniphilus]ORJ61597.1 ribosomal RNA small subunit methyltransferase A [Geothermobacter hydrogeniphilus]
MSVNQGHRAKKRFGQNFLRDRHVVGEILAAAEITATDRVLEIGPGLGALTDGLLRAAGEVLIMELDRDLLQRWQQRPEPNLRVLAGDALKLDWPQLLEPAPVKLVANLPYNISSQVIFKILDHRQLFSRLVLMFQKEVGERLRAAPGCRDYGILSVLCRQWFDIRRVVKVPPQAFRPAPKVDSVVLRFDPLPEPRVVVDQPELFLRVVKGAFVQRRKTLRNSLLAAGFEAGVLDAALQRSDILPTRRGETLELEEFARLTRNLQA